MVLSLLGVVAFGCDLFRAAPTFPRWLSLVICGLLLAAAGWCVRVIIHPFEWEVVVNDGQIFWGRADQPDRQQRVTVSQLVCLIHDKSDGRVVGDTGRWPSLEIGAGILLRSEDRQEFVDYLRQNFPKLKIETT